jgi:Helix-turn-helix domain
MKPKHFNWDSLVPHLVHPVKVAIIEAMEWVGVPVSPRELDRIFDEQFGVSLVSYHMRTLADVGVVEKVRQQSVRGAVQTFYSLSAKEPASPSVPCE